MKNQEWENIKREELGNKIDELDREIEKLREHIEELERDVEQSTIQSQTEYFVDDKVLDEEKIQPEERAMEMLADQDHFELIPVIYTYYYYNLFCLDDENLPRKEEEIFPAR